MNTHVQQKRAREKPKCQRAICFENARYQDMYSCEITKINIKEHHERRVYWYIGVDEHSREE